MKNVIKMFVAMAVMGVMTVSAFAQGAGPGGPKGGAPGAQGGKGGQGGAMRRMDLDTDVLAKLNLTAAQKTKVKALKDARNAKAQELFKSMGGPGAGAGKGGAKGGQKPPAGGPPAGGAKGGPGGGMSGMREKMKPIQDAYLAGIKATLTPAQFTAYEKGVKEAREKMRAQFGGGKGGPGTAGAAGKAKGKGGPPPTN